VGDEGWIWLVTLVEICLIWDTVLGSMLVCYLEVVLMKVDKCLKVCRLTESRCFLVDSVKIPVIEKWMLH